MSRITMTEETEKKPVEVRYYASEGIDRNCPAFVEGAKGVRKRLFIDAESAGLFRGLMLHRSLRKQALFTEMSVTEMD